MVSSVFVELDPSEFRQGEIMHAKHHDCQSLPVGNPGAYLLCREKLFRKARPVIITIVPGEDENLARRGVLTACTEPLTAYTIRKRPQDPEKRPKFPKPSFPRDGASSQ